MCCSNCFRLPNTCKINNVYYFFKSNLHKSINSTRVLPLNRFHFFSGNQRLIPALLRHLKQTVAAVPPYSRKESNRLESSMKWLED